MECSELQALGRVGEAWTVLSWDRTEAAAGRAGSHQGRHRLRVRNECGAGGTVRRTCHRAEALCREQQAVWTEGMRDIADPELSDAVMDAEL